MCSPGPHAFVIVVNGRCTPENIRVLELFQKIFGKNVLKYCIIVITHEDDIRNDYDDQLSDDELIVQYLNEAPQPLLDLMTNIEQRCILINNRAPYEIREEKVARLVDMIKIIEQKNQYYTNQIFIKAEKQWIQWETDEIERQRRDREQRRENLRKQVIRRKRTKFVSFVLSSFRFVKKIFQEKKLFNGKNECI